VRKIIVHWRKKKHNNTLYRAPPVYGLEKTPMFDELYYIVNSVVDIEKNKNFVS
jgi:hypothetical protein